MHQYPEVLGALKVDNTVPDQPVVHDIVFVAQSKIYIAVLGKKYISFFSVTVSLLSSIHSELILFLPSQLS